MGGLARKPEQATTNVYRIGSDGKLTAVLTELVNPNGLAFSPDEKKLYVIEWKGTPNRSIWSYDVAADGIAGQQGQVVDAADQGALDGFRVDRDGNLWCGWGSNGALKPSRGVGGRKVFRLKGKPEDLDGVMVFSPRASRSASSVCPSAAPTCASAAEEQPALHGELPFALRSLRRGARRRVG